jgi:hypothetical protein
MMSLGAMEFGITLLFYKTVFTTLGELEPMLLIQCCSDMYQLWKATVCLLFRQVMIKEMLATINSSQQ